MPTTNLQLSIINRLSDTLEERSVRRAAEQDPQFAAYVSRLQSSLITQSKTLRRA